jgi:hypothetical protein
MSKQIWLGGKSSTGKYAVVSDTDFEWLSQYNWCARKYLYGGSVFWYACTRVGKKIYQMHRMITGVHLSQCPRVDHKNHNTLDNQRHNLRKCTNSQNMANRFPYNKYSKYKGIRLKANGRWEAFISTDRKQKYLGVFTKEEDAALAYDIVAKTIYGEFAVLNFPR